MHSGQASGVVIKTVAVVGFENTVIHPNTVTEHTPQQTIMRKLVLHIVFEQQQIRQEVGFEHLTVCILADSNMCTVARQVVLPLKQWQWWDSNPRLRETGA